MKNLNLFWPTKSGIVTQQFGAAGAAYGSKGHSGIDIRVKGEPHLFAAAKGRVILANIGVHDWFSYNGKTWVATTNFGKGSAFGNHVIIDHDGYFTLYGHMNLVSVKVGQEVDMGQVIGVPGNTGQSKGPHCHFELRMDKNSIDHAMNPLPYMTFNIKEDVDPNLASEWALEAQKFVKDNKISDGTRPHDQITREEVWVMLERFYNLLKK